MILDVSQGRDDDDDEPYDPYTTTDPKKGNLLHVKVRLFGSGYLPKHTLYFGREELHLCHDLGLNSRQMTRQVSSVHCRIL